ncbi:MAG: DUF6364 family protein [Actinomycetota bacterium]
MKIRNITLSMPDELVRRAKVLAAERDTSVSALVASLLDQVVGDADDYQQRWAEEEAAMDRGLLKVGAVTWSREDLHHR